MDLRELVSGFTDTLTKFVEAQVIERARTAIDSALGANGVRPRARRKGPIQLCPVPGCKNRAAPVFGMVCSEHKGLPKAKIKKYRDARRKKQVKAPKRG
jgi:hypothetical protein